MKNIVILGHGVGVKFVVESLIKSNSNFRVVALVTHPKKEHEHDLNLMNKRKELLENLLTMSLMWNLTIM